MSTMHFRRAPFRIVLLATIVAGLLPVVSLGAIQYWDPSTDAGYQHGDGTWSIAPADANWGPNATAARSAWTNDNQARFEGTGGSSLITLNSAVSSTGMLFTGGSYTLNIANDGRVSNRTVTVQMSGADNRIELAGGASSATWINLSTLQVGLTNGGNAFVVNGAGVPGSALATNAGVITVGNQAASQGNWLIVTNGGHLFSSAAPVIGNTASAGNRAEVTGGGALWNLGNQALTVGRTANATGNVLRIDGQSIAGGAVVTNLSTLSVGNIANANSNELIVTRGGQLYTTAAFIGNTSSYNQATVDGSGSLWQLNGLLYVGHAGATGNVLTIGNGAVVTNATGVRVGSVAGAFQNRMVLTNGGALFSSGSATYIGNASSSNTVEVTGGASLWNLGNTNLFIGNGAGAIGNTLTMDQGGVVTNIANLFIGNGAGAIGNTLTIDRGGAADGVGTLTVRPTNSLAFLGGMLSVSNLTVTNGVIQNIGDGTQAAELVIRGGTHTNNVGFMVQSNATVSGRGRLAGASSGVVFAAGSTLRPGVPGSAATTVATLQLGPSTWHGGMTLDLNITNVAGTAGTDWDFLQVLGGMNFVTNGVKLRLRLDSAGVTSGGFDPNISRVIPLITYSNSSIAQDDVEMDTTNFLIGSNWLVEVAAWGIQLHYQRPAPYIYVSTNGSNGGGSSWGSAYTDLQEAINNAQNLDTIFLAGGQTFEGGALGSAYPSNTVFLMQDRVNVTLRGGYQADPALSAENHPGTNNPASWPTFLRRASGNVRVLTLNAVSNVRFEGVTITNGYMNTDVVGAAWGGGVRVDGSRNVTFSKCDISGNTAHATGGTTRRPDGGGIYITGSDVSILDSRLVGNRANGGDNTHTMGGAAFVTSGSLTILRSLVSGNRSSGNGSGTGRAGGFYITSTGSLDIRESVVNFNNATHNQSGDVGEAGAVFNAGTLWMQNCLVVSNRVIRTTAHSDGLFLNGGTATVVNCTIADNYRIGIQYNAGSVAVSNSIIWGHTSSDLLNFPADGDGKLTNVWYSCIQVSPNAGFQGCTGVDPLFADRTNYHLQSTEEHYTGGYFSGGSWTTAAGDSPVIDRGDPVANFSREPLPNGGRINMGAYGGTEVAAKTTGQQANPPQVDNPGAQAWGHRTATLRGIVTDTGGQIPEAWFLYAPDGEPLANRTDVGPQSGSFSAAISGLPPGLLYQYAVVASNQGGVVQSDSAWFSTHPIGSSLYVATNGHHTAGTNWSTAYNDLQTAFDIAEAGDTIYLAGHTFARAADFGNLFAFRMQNLTNITIRGGYDAAGDDPLPGGRNASTRLTRASGDIRVLALNAVSNIWVEQVTITNGYLQATISDTALGGGLHVNASRAVTFAACDISGNTARGTGASHPQGGGIHVAGNSEVTLVDSRMVGNRADGGENTHTYGGAAYVASGTLNLLRSLAVNNQSRGNGGGTGYAGALYIAAGGTLDLRESVIKSNTTSHNQGGDVGEGGAVFNAGTLWMQNCLVASNRAIRTTAHSDGLSLSGGTATLVNCTVADNFGVGLQYNAGTVAVTNSILWGHTTSNVWNYPESGGIFQNMSYTLIGGYPAMDNVNGCLVADPLFDDRVYYHLQSRRGVYRGGYFSGGTWGTAAENSPALDAGTNLAFIAWQDEPAPNGKRLNMGAYGGTPVASHSPVALGSVFMIR